MELVIEAGFEAFEANNADEAISILESHADIHLVFTDVEMPGTMDGNKLAHHIRKRWPPVKLIVAAGTAILDESHLPEGARFFPKPYGNQPIVEAMMAMLAVARNGHCGG